MPWHGVIYTSFAEVGVEWCEEFESETELEGITYNTCRQCWLWAWVVPGWSNEWKMFITIPVGLFAVVLKGDKREKLELYGDGADRGQRLYQELAVFFCVRRLNECFSEEMIHTHTFS